MECSICLNLLTEPPANLFTTDLVDVTETKKSEEQEETKKPSKLCCTPCGHVFHRNCLVSWFESKRRRTCPFCRKRVSQQKLYPVYLDSLSQGNARQRELQSTEDTIFQTSSHRRKSTSLFSFLMRACLCLPPSTGDQGLSQQLQVAVTINCVSESTQPANGALANTEPNLQGRTTLTDRSQEVLCSCRCPHHHPH